MARSRLSRTALSLAAATGLVGLVAATLTAQVAGPSPGAVRVIGVERTGPRVELDLAVPGAPVGPVLTPSGVAVTAGGRPVPADVVPRREPLAVALSLDPTLAGAALVAAQGAAQELVRTLPPSTRFAVAGGGGPDARLRLTGDHGQVLRAIEAVREEEGLAWSDVLDAALEGLGGGGGRRAAVVLGFDLGGTAPPPRPLLDRLDGSVDVHVLGLGAPADEEVAGALTARGGTRRALGGPVDLAGAVVDLAAVLTSQYAVGLDLPEPGAARLRITVQGVGSASVSVPAVGAPLPGRPPPPTGPVGPAAPAKQGEADQGGDGLPAAVLVAGLAAAATAAVVVVARTLGRRRRHRPPPDPPVVPAGPVLDLTTPEHPPQPAPPERGALR